jgi:hypothetical protein
MRFSTLAFCCMITVALFSCKKEILRPQQVPEPTQHAQPAATVYDEARTLRVPGNYQQWNVAAAPRIVSANGNGQYEGYINFTRPDTEFWLVKGTAWDNVTTYNETGNNTFGHNGGFFTVGEGAGIYKVNADKNKFTWSCTRISSWSVSGTAVSAGGSDVEMTVNASALSWSITRNFIQGSFLFRANKGNSIVLGQEAEGGDGMAGYNAQTITVPRSGNYTITLSMQPGNYTYSVTRNH